MVGDCCEYSVYGQFGQKEIHPYQREKDFPEPAKPALICGDMTAGD
jgi:hypothetical protein